jgi:hypothetical protein
VAAACEERLVGCSDRPCGRSAPRALSCQRPHPRTARDPRRQGYGAHEGRADTVATRVVLLGLPTQHLNQGPRWQLGARWHRLPRDGHGDLSRAQQDDDPHGRRRRSLVGPGMVFQAPPRVREPRRRHLLPLGLACHPRGRGGGRQHHVQDSLQRCGGHDGWAAGGRADHGAAHRPSAHRGGCAAHRTGGGGPIALVGPFGFACRPGRASVHRPSSQRNGRRPARVARLRRRVGPDLRPGVRR